MESDNAYADLVGAARQIDVEPFPPYLEFAPHQLIELVARHASQLGAAREALKRPCRVEVRMEQAFYAEHWPETNSLRHLIQLIAYEAQLAASRQDLAQVIQCGLDLLELGNAMRRGGMVLDFLVGVAGSGSGVDLLRTERAKFSDELRKTLIAELQRIEAEAESIETIIARDREWETKTNFAETEAEWKFEPSDPEELGISIEDQRELHNLFEAAAEQERQLPPEQQRQLERGVERFQQAMLRLLVTDLALCRFQHAQGVLPNRLHLLVPKFLSALPLDPFTNAPFIYRRHGETFELYSTGPKKVDGGGSFGSTAMVHMHQADLCLDVSDIADPENACAPAQEIARGG